MNSAASNPAAVSLSNFLHDCVQAGDILHAKGPSGQFTVDSSIRHPVLFLAAGIGITPVVSMLHQAASHSSQRPIGVLYQSRTPEQTPLAKELIELASRHPQVQLLLAFSALPNTYRSLHERHANIAFVGGRVAVGKVAKQIDASAVGHCYLCGPATWMKHAIDDLTEAGFSEAQIHYESFGSQFVTKESMHERTTLPSDTLVGQHHIKLAETGKEVRYTASGGSLLDQLQRAGADVAGGCRVGNCGTCMTRLLRGKVDAGQHTCRDLADDWILPCVATPQSDIELQA